MAPKNQKLGQLSLKTAGQPKMDNTAANNTTNAAASNVTTLDRDKSNSCAAPTNGEIILV